MTDEELETLGKQMWKLQRDEKDPFLKIIFGVIHEQTVNLRKGPETPPVSANATEDERLAFIEREVERLKLLHGMLLNSLRGLAKALERRRH